ncbi:MAG: L-lactate permease [Anaerolineae bacterium]
MPWTQTYVPLGSFVLSAFVAGLPALVLLGLLGSRRAPAHVAALCGWATAFALAAALYGMPVPLAAMASIYGAAYGLFPIGWIVIGAIFLYDIAVESGTFDQVKEAIASISPDRRIQTLLIAFSFGAFIEGAAGFGTPVAISAAMLMGLGFPALPAAGLALIGNTAPVPFAALGTPIIALASVTGLPVDALGAMVGRQLALFPLLIPFWLVWVLAGRRATLEVWPACLVCGATYTAVQVAVSAWHGPYLVALAASVASILALTLLMRFWQPASLWHFPHERGTASAVDTASSGAGHTSLRAWTPWALLLTLVFVWSLAPVQATLDRIGTIRFAVPFLHQAVRRMPPVVPQPTLESAVFTLNALSATGTSLVVTAIASGLLLGFSGADLARLFVRTLRKLRFSLLTIAATMALGFVSRYGGLDATMGLAFAATGTLFPFFSPLLGWFGVTVTGSDTSSNVLFGNLQRVTAEQLGISPVLAAAANSSGGVMGKMLNAQSIVVASAATGQHGIEGDILRYVFIHSLTLALMVGGVVLLMAYTPL